MSIPTSLRDVFIGANAASTGPNFDLIENSLRFRQGQVLTKTFSTTGNRETNTLSLWCKRSMISALEDDNYTLVTADPNNNYDELGFTQNYGSTESDEVWYRIQGGYYVIPNGRFRDPTAWYHLVFRRDGTQSTAANRLRMYINGVERGYRATNYQPQNQVWGKLCAAVQHRIGSYDGTYQYFDGYMAEIHLVDGTSLGPETFGEYDENGVWIPKKVSGVTYGTNGFYLDFSDPSNIGADRSGNGHNFTPSGFELSNTTSINYDWMEDTPTKNYCTLSSISGDHWGLTKANLTTAQGGAAYRNAIATHQIPPGASKIYFEARVARTTGGANGVRFGLAGTTDFNENNPTTPYAFIYLAGGGGNVNVNGTNVGSISGVSAGAILQCAYDPSNGKVWFGVNNSWYFSGNPSGGTNPAGTLASETLSVWGSNYDDELDFNWGNRPYTYTPPTGFGRLATPELPEADIKDPSEYFNTVLYSGNGSSNRAITGVGFQPDLVWIKARNANENNNLYDAVRGATKFIMSNSSSAEQTNTATLKSFDSDGFTVGDAALVNWNGWTYAAWCWKAGNGTSTNTNGSITSTVSVNPTAGFSVVSYTGNGSSGATIGHGLGAVPSMVILKSRSSASWTVYHGDIDASNPAAYYLILESTSNRIGRSDIWNNTVPNSSTIVLGNNGVVNSNGVNYIAYCWSEIPGYSSFGRYVGSGDTDGTFVYTGFRPAFVLIKGIIGAAYNWTIIDASRDTYNPTVTRLHPNSSASEVPYTAGLLDFTANGFKFRCYNSSTNDIHFNSNANYVYMAFAENPFGGNNVYPSPAQ